MGRWCDLVAPNAVRSRTSTIQIPPAMAKYGEHTKEVLTSIGYDEEAIEQMIASGVAGMQWSDKYLPE